MRIIILGGGSAGTSVAFELRKKSKECEITIIEETGNNEYSPCSLPYVLCKEIDGFEKIFLFSDSDYIREDIKLIKNARATIIEPDKKIVSFKREGKEESMQYDYLVYALGSTPRMPPIDIADDAKYHFFRTIEDAKNLGQDIKEGKKMLILGGGLIGVEAAYAGANAGMDVTIVEYGTHLLHTVMDKDMSSHLEEFMGKHGIRVVSSTAITRIDSNKLYSDNEEYEYDTLVVATGLSPNTGLAQKSGINVNHGIAVDSSFRTNYDNIFAAGDCIELDRMNDDACCVMLGSLAFQSARVIADNILGTKSSYNPVLGAAIAKLGSIIIATTGMTLQRAKEKGINAYGMIIEGSTRSGYHPDSKRIVVKLIANSEKKLIGAQILGGEDVSGRINLCTLAIAEGIGIDKIAFLETVYNPGSAPINEPLAVCARMLMRKIDVIANASK
jgi:NADH oxidase (H2O2-forming)